MNTDVSDDCSEDSGLICGRKVTVDFFRVCVQSFAAVVKVTLCTGRAYNYSGAVDAGPVTTG